MTLTTIGFIIAALVVNTAAQGIVPTEGGPVDLTETNAEFWKYVATQSGLLVALLVVLWSYRRQLVADSTRAKDDAARMESILSKTTEAITNSAVASARQTDATHRLARTVEHLERRISGHSEGGIA